MNLNRPKEKKKMVVFETHAHPKLALICCDVQYSGPCGAMLLQINQNDLQNC